MQHQALKTSLNISTYNWPEALNLCLLSVKRQTVLPDEVVIADDGSTESTRKLIEKHKADFPVPIVHVWQPDEGFQLAKIRNKGIAASSHKYIIQIDGDLILHPNFIEDHINFSQPNAFAAGSRVLIDQEQSAKMITAGDYRLNVFSKGLANRLNGFRVKLLRNYMAKNYKVNNNMYLRGCNMAFWRKDLIEINGYNEDFTGWGWEDNDIAIRLINNGKSKRMIKFGGIVYHIYHSEKPKVGIGKNYALLEEAINQKLTHCKKGLNQYL